MKPQLEHNLKKCLAQKQNCTSLWEGLSHSEVWRWPHHVLGLFLFISWIRGLSEGGENRVQFHTINHFWHKTFRLGKLSRKKNFTVQPHKDSTHSSKSTKMRLHNKKMKVLEWPSQIPVMNPAKLSVCGVNWRGLHGRGPRSLTDFKCFCKEEWAEIANSRRAVIIECCNNIKRCFNNVVV